jgi:hypothetical protein
MVRHVPGDAQVPLGVVGIPMLRAVERELRIGRAATPARRGWSSSKAASTTSSWARERFLMCGTSGKAEAVSKASSSRFAW